MAAIVVGRRVFSLAVVLALLLMLAVAIVPASPAFAATLNVPSGYATIQAAVNAANPGDTILVAAGTYPENVVIGKANLTLQSIAPLGAIIQPTITAPGWPSAAVLITANGVTVDGFEIDGTTVATNGIVGWNTSSLTIKNNKVHGANNQWDGIGIIVWSWGSGGTVYNNLIQDNEVYDTGRMGIFVMDHGATTYTVTSGNTITGNTVHDVWKKAIAWGDGGGGIQINVGKNCAITNNEVYDVRDGQRGIYMFGSAAGNTITGNTLRDNPVGIKLWISGEGGTTITWGSETATSPQVHFNNIYNNGLGGNSTNIAGTPMEMDAENNWWGNSGGPGSGGANGVTGLVDYTPWLTAAVSDSKTETTSTGYDIVVATTEADTTVVKTGSGTPTITVAKYASNPGSGFTGTIGKYIDVHLDSTTNVGQIDVNLYYTAAEIAGLDESTLRMYYLNGSTSTWELCQYSPACPLA